MNMDIMWRAMASKDCEDSIANIYHTAKEFPELLVCDDNQEELKDYLEKICDLLTLSIPWDDEDDE